jgi:signal transduction histidine kinase/DNA-binding response OmpR family regulator/HAMP domain-containing protein
MASTTAVKSRAGRDATSATIDAKIALSVLAAVKKGDFSARMPNVYTGSARQVANAINEVIESNQRLEREIRRLSRRVGKEGQVDRTAMGDAGSAWAPTLAAVNDMVEDLVRPNTEMVRVIGAVANGDLSQTMALEIQGRRLQGQFLETAKTVNTMVNQLRSFSSEVTRVAREVGTDGKLGGQAQVRGVGGVWKDLTDNVNTMASNLTDQVRGIARVVTAVANGNLRGKLTVEAKGEIAELADTINSMTDTLAVFAEQVTSVAREVGVEGRLGGQAKVPGAAGTWRDLTDNVNQLSATLTTQVRAIAEVATAVTKGDLTRSIGVEARGEVAVLKDNINEMIHNLKETTEKTTEQDWLKTNLTRFTRMLQGQRDPMTVSKMILSELAPLVHAEHGVFYGMVGSNGSPPRLAFQAGYAYKQRTNLAREFNLGEGLIGQCALEKRRILVTDVPADYIRITSGVGEATPANIIVLPVLFESDVRAVIELASFRSFSPTHLDFLDQLMESIGIVLNTIEANSRTEELLTQSQSLANELQSQQDRLQRTNEELAEKARQLVQQNAEIDHRRNEVESAKTLVEQKAAQLEITSRYKSEFLANMSHELRTPLNSLLILAQELAANPDGNLLPKQIEFATIIRASGTDLLKLINDILDLSKIESGTVALEISNWPLAELKPMLERTFRHVADATNVSFTIDVRPGLRETIPTDPQRLQQVLNNLLSNAFKFTERGRVEFVAQPATSGWNPGNEALNQATGVVAFRVIDTGIGIPPEKQQSIFEAFAQVDGTTSRKYGGTGLGLSICRELTRLLGGEIRLDSEQGVGSAFTVYLPVSSPARSGRISPSRTANGWSDDPAEGANRAVAVAAAGSRTWQDRGSPPVAEAHQVEATKSLLVLEGDPVHRQFIVDLMKPVNAATTAVATGDEALEFLAREAFDCVVLDLGLQGSSGWKVIAELEASKAMGSTPLLVYTARELTRKEEARLNKNARSIVIKDARSPERLREEIAAILTSSEPSTGAELVFSSRMPEAADGSLAGTRVLVVDDDIRNIFALTAVLERHGMDVISVDSGREAIEVLEENGNIDVALVDMMMAEIDGYATLSELRKLPMLRDKPIIALTAKAMKGDREKCLEAGASDYIAKPVNNAQLLALLKSWVAP